MDAPRSAGGSTRRLPHAYPFSRVAWTLWGVSAALDLASLPLFVLTWVSPAHAWSTTVMYAVLTLLFLVLQGIGALVIARQRAKPIGWIFTALGLIGSSSGFCVAYAAYAPLAAPLSDGTASVAAMAGHRLARHRRRDHAAAVHGFSPGSVAIVPYSL